MNHDRLTQFASIISNRDFDLVAVNPGPTLYYLTGLSFHLMERPIILLITPEDPPVLILPELEATKAEQAGFDMRHFTYGEDDESRLRAFNAAVSTVGKGSLRVGVEPLRWRFFEGSVLHQAAPDWQFTSADELMNDLRLIKDTVEIDKMRQAVRIAESALQSARAQIKVGMSERDLASELTAWILRAGSEADLPFEPIIASGPNSALPHATPSERILEAGDLLIIDWGARYEGYISDLTRTFAIATVDPELEKITRLVQDANQAAREAVSPGITCGAVDEAARRVIDKAGYGEFFTHRTGHGIGLDTHEPPYIRSGETLVLQPGITFTIEPGIYLPGRGGARVEDDVVVTQDGIESFSQMSRDLEVLG